MQIEIRQYQTHDAAAAAAIWNEVVRGGAAFPQREELTEEEENAVVLRELKQTKETLESAPADRADIREQCERRITVLQEFAPREMSEEEIRAQIQASLAVLGIEQPTIRDKGRLMKELMPRVKGKADGALVNRLVTELLA